MPRLVLALALIALAMPAAATFSIVAYDPETGELGDRLIAALEAGQAAGGDSRGQQSAALLVTHVHPDYPEYVERDVDLDTLAEVHFRRGEAAKAIEVETRALELSPEDAYLKEQLARFREGR